MQKLSSKLGRVLAYLEILESRAMAPDTARTSPPDEELYGLVRKRLEALRKRGGNNVETGQAETHFDRTLNTLLEGIFRETAWESGGDTPCNQLVRALNDDYAFFEEYAEVMRGYHRGIEEYAHIQ